MIHQFILAAPRPGMTTSEFQDYWVTVHAVKYAARIPQIRRYVMDTRVPFDGDRDWPRLPHQGIAEIWLENEEEQIASLMSPEFLHGARPDEPNFAAFWLTLVLDTTAHELVPGPSRRDPEPPWVKLTTLHRRRPGTPLADYRDQSLRRYAPLVGGLPGLRRHLHCHTRDSAYGFGEPRFDGVEQVWFDDLPALDAALRSAYHADQVAPVLRELVDPAYVFRMVTREHWIIDP